MSRCHPLHTVPNPCPVPNAPFAFTSNEMQPPPFAPSATAAQRALLERCGVRDARTLLDAAAREAEACGLPGVPDVNLPHPVYKRYLIGFLTRHCGGAQVDFRELRAQRVVVAGGAYPNQWIALHPRLARARGVAPSAAATRAQREADALAAALRASRAEAEAAARARGRRAAEEAPVELCCPIGLDLLVDPVATVHGQVYERAHIEAWLEKHDTDPLTGERLWLKQLWPDEELAERCALYRAFA